MTGFSGWHLVLLFAASALVSAGLIKLIHPLLARYALARPDARSSHRQPTPQGAGIAVIAATMITLAGAVTFGPFAIEPFQLALVCGGSVFLAGVGAADDIRKLGALPRLILQAAAVAALLAALPAELRVFPPVPLWIERVLMFAAALWFVNLVNFMDGIDWMTAAEIVPLTAALALFGLMGALPGTAAVCALVLCGAMIGFAPFNRPVARVFLGDVGSLPIGLLLAWMLIVLAGNGHIAAALLLPLYYLADATITLLRRLAAGEPILEAHRGHFYQRALDRGVAVSRIVGEVFVLNLVLIALAMGALVTASCALQAAALLLGCAAVGALLWRFARG